jgi:hypothetical protein
VKNRGRSNRRISGGFNLFPPESTLALIVGFRSADRRILALESLLGGPIWPFASSTARRLLTNFLSQDFGGLVCNPRATIGTIKRVAFEFVLGEGLNGYPKRIGWA